MRNRGLRILSMAVLLAGSGAVWAADGSRSTDSQGALQPVIDSEGRTLSFDWPIINVGSAYYKEGPTGVTVLRFGEKVNAAVDVRGGAPGTVNAHYLELGYENTGLDAITFSGGSWYGLEAVTAVASAMKDDGLGDSTNILLGVGAIINDLSPGRRLNEYYPDKRLAQAAYRAARPGRIPLGGAGAGRMAMSGGFFGCNAHSGQGAAFRKIGNVKILAFTVVNSLGVVVDRDGLVKACHPDADWPTPLRVTDLFERLPERVSSGMSTRNTTLSVVVVNTKLSPAELKRLAAQVHTSMNRAIQPFATQSDGDVLFAVSTDEISNETVSGRYSEAILGAIASEVMWDAVLSSVPEPPKAVLPVSRTVSMREATDYAGTYSFSPIAQLRVTAANGVLQAQASGKRAIFAIGRDVPAILRPTGEPGLFTVPGRYPLSLKFDGKGTLVVNPGPWAQQGKKLTE